MKKKILVGILAALLVFTCFACGKDKSKDKDDANKQETEQSQDQSDDNESEGTEQTNNGDSQAQEPNEGDNLVVNESSQEKDYVGSWTMIGRIMSDGSIEPGKMTQNYSFKNDKTVTAEGEIQEGNGTWKLIDKGAISVTINGKTKKFTKNNSGYLMLSSGERDGKGNIMNYAFENLK